jgi:hypothetical protein
MSSNLVVSWPGGIGNPVGERIPTSDIAQTRGGVGDTKVIPGFTGGKRKTRRNRKNRKQTRKNRKNRKQRASTRRSRGRRLCGVSM